MSIEELREFYIKACNEDINKIKKYEDEIEKAKEKGDERKEETFTKLLKDTKEILRKHKAMVEFIRPDTEEDKIERKYATERFAKEISNIIPDNVPFVFHGTAITNVEAIIKSGGLLSPLQRGVHIGETLNSIDVSQKNNIQTTCNFANISTAFMPYGAIFVFMPLKSEYEKVLSTGQSTEVRGGVEGVNFKENPERLIGIITTSENKKIIEKFCQEAGWYFDNVYTHMEFINKCQELNSNLEETSNKRL